MITKLLELISKGIEDGALARFLLTLVASAMLIYLTVTRAIATDAALAFIGTVVGYFFGAQGKKAGV